LVVWAKEFHSQIPRAPFGFGAYSLIVRIGLATTVDAMHPSGYTAPCGDQSAFVKELCPMRRYTNWSLIAFVGLLVIAALTSEQWIPEVQPSPDDEAQVESFGCPGYLEDEQCGALRELAVNNLELAETLRELLDPENDLEVLNEPEITAVARDVNPATSDEPIITEVKKGSFGDLNVVLQAEGVVTVYEVVHSGVTARFLRFEEGFRVISGPDLEIFLSSAQAPRIPEQLFDSQNVEVAFLKGNVGPQNYELDTDIDLTQYRSVAIYSEELDLIVAVAPIVVT
jgi:hypothetical protein